MTTPPRLPAATSRALARLPVDAATGKRHISIPLAAFDTQWRSGPIDDWIATYRPDLVAHPGAPPPPPTGPGRA